MITTNERNIATSLIRELVNLGLTDNLAWYGDNSAEEWFWENRAVLSDYWFSSGATKACISHPDLCGWVIKVGYTEHVSKDYATVEYNNYCAAIEEGLAQYFPETVYIGEFDGCAFYAQEAAECDEDLVTSKWYYKLRDQYIEDGNENPNDEEIWDEIDCYDDDEKVFLSFGNNQLCNFIWSRDINDLHEGNFGYIGDRMVIIDFSGFRGY